MLYRSGYARDLGLAYQITKDTKYAEKAKEALLNMDYNLPVAITTRVERAWGLRGYSLAYDWIQPYLDPASNSIIRDKLATQADILYKDMIADGPNIYQVSAYDLHGQAYPVLGIAGLVLMDYTNPGGLNLSSAPADWLRTGTTDIFVNDTLHSYGRSLWNVGFDDAGQFLTSDYKQYIIDDFAWWLQIYSYYYKKNAFDVYPMAKLGFTTEIWNAMPNHYQSNLMPAGATIEHYHRGFMSLLDDGNKSYVLNHIEKGESTGIAKLLPYGDYRLEGAYMPGTLLYLVYGNYSSIQRKYPSWTSHLDSTSIFQVIRGGWTEDSDWLSLVTWNATTGSWRDSGHGDQLGFEYYGRGDLLLADAGEAKHAYYPGSYLNPATDHGMLYGAYEVFHNVIAFENPRAPFGASEWANSTARGIYKGEPLGPVAITSFKALTQTPWMTLMDVTTRVSKIIGLKYYDYNTLSSPIQYGRAVLYPKDYFIIIDRLESAESWTYRNVFRPSSLVISPSLDANRNYLLEFSEIGHVNLDLAINNINYDWLSLPYNSETSAGNGIKTIKWNTTNPYGNKVEASLFTVPSSEARVTKHIGRVAGYDLQSDVFNPVIYFRTPSANNLYRVTVLLSRYSNETEKVPSEIPVTGTGSAVKVTSPAYEDYVYSGRGSSSFASFSTDADTAYIRKTTEPKEYTMINGSYVNYAGFPLVAISKKVDYLTLKKEGNITTFEIKGTGTAQITVKGAVGKNYVVKRDGVPYANFVMSGNDLVISAVLD